MSATATPSTLQTPYGKFTGNVHDGCVQYLGIKYATLENQLAVPKMVELRKKAGVFDATKLGPQAAGMGGPTVEQNMLIQQEIEIPPAPRTSGTDCLNLNITVPDVDAEENGKLPVMVFVHGGGYMMGSNWWPQYDPARFVGLSVELKRPVIVVNINYRLGALGNLTSEELRNAGYPGNNSLRDQKCAFQWIQKHISAFGGDADSITAFGVSAGGAAVLTLLESEEPLFKRAISMSGTPLMLKPLPAPGTEGIYASLIKELGLENAPVEERLNRLLTIDPDELVAKTPMGLPLLPFLDGDIIRSTKSFKELESTAAKRHPWCSELMFGDCQHDGTVFNFMGLQPRKVGIGAAFCASLTKNLSCPAAAEAVLQAYEIDPSTSDDHAMSKIFGFATDIAYHAPARVYAKSNLYEKTCYYRFDEPNPWNGPFKGLVTHLLDATFLFQNYNHKLSVAACKVAEDFADRLLMFAHGESGWGWCSKKKCGDESCSKGCMSISFRPFGRGHGNDSMQAILGARSDHLFKLKKEGKIDLDELSLAWDLFLGGQ